MTKEDELYFDTYSLLFNTDGWKQLVKDFEGMGHLLNQVELTSTVDELHFKKGQLNIIAQILNLETTTSAAKEAALADEEDLNADAEWL